MNTYFHAMPCINSASISSDDGFVDHDDRGDKLYIARQIETLNEWKNLPSSSKTALSLVVCFLKLNET